MLFVSEYVMLSPLDMTPDEKQNIPCYMDVVYIGCMTETNNLI